jgi:hypothetical protein
LVSEHFPWQELWAIFFSIFAVFFGETKEGRDISDDLCVFMCKILHKMVVYLSSSQKNTQFKKKNRLKRSPGSKVIEVLKSAIFQGFSADDDTIFLFL